VASRVVMFLRALLWVAWGAVLLPLLVVGSLMLPACLGGLAKVWSVQVLGGSEQGSMVEMCSPACLEGDSTLWELPVCLRWGSPRG
jgi:hypothetical protein